MVWLFMKTARILAVGLFAGELRQYTSGSALTIVTASKPLPCMFISIQITVHPSTDWKCFREKAFSLENYSLRAEKASRDQADLVAAACTASCTKSLLTLLSRTADGHEIHSMPTSKHPLCSCHNRLFYAHR
jgi:hypothetical protein